MVVGEEEKVDEVLPEFMLRMNSGWENFSIFFFWLKREWLVGLFWGVVVVFWGVDGGYLGDK